MARNLTFNVDVKQTYYWETIAAFNCEQPAVWYMTECSQNGLGFKYRVRKSSGKIVAGDRT